MENEKKFRSGRSRSPLRAAEEARTRANGTGAPPLRRRRSQRSRCVYAPRLSFRGARLRCHAPLSPPRAASPRGGGGRSLPAYDSERRPARHPRGARGGRGRQERRRGRPPACHFGWERVAVARRSCRALALRLMLEFQTFFLPREGFLTAKTRSDNKKSHFGGGIREFLACTMFLGLTFHFVSPKKNVLAIAMAVQRSATHTCQGPTHQRRGRLHDGVYLPPSKIC